MATNSIKVTVKRGFLQKLAELQKQLPCEIMLGGVFCLNLRNVT